MEARPSQESKALVFNRLNLHVHFDVIYYGLVSSENVGEEKAWRLLNDLKEEVKTIYKGNV